MHEVAVSPIVKSVRGASSSAMCTAVLVSFRHMQKVVVLSVAGNSVCCRQLDSVPCSVAYLPAGGGGQRGGQVPLPDVLASGAQAPARHCGYHPGWQVRPLFARHNAEEPPVQIHNKEQKMS